MNIVSFGGGTNSTAMIIGMYLHKIPVDLILFADTGGEQPHTYATTIRRVWRFGKAVAASTSTLAMMQAKPAEYNTPRWRMRQTKSTKTITRSMNGAGIEPNVCE